MTDFKIEILNVKGSDREIGRQHAERVGEAAKKGMVRFYFEFMHRLLKTGPQKGVRSLLFKAAQKAIDPGLTSQLIKRIPDDARERLLGVSEGTGIPFRDLAVTMVLPDLFPMLQSMYARFNPKGVIQLPQMGCSSFVLSNEELWHGRNLDFPGVGYWDRFPVVQVTEKSHDKKALRYIGFCSAGVPVSGITGINEAQISVSLHQHYCKTFSLGGTLPFVIGEWILTYAKDLKSALELIQKYPVATSWAFIVCDGKTGEAFICERHPSGMGVRWLKKHEPSMSHSNCYQTKECKPYEYATTLRMVWDNAWRAKRMKYLVEEATHNFSATRAVQIMGDHFDGYLNGEKVINRTISQAYNTQSLVFNVTQMKAWVAEGHPPIQLRGYRELDLGDLFSGRGPGAETHLGGFQFMEPAKQRAKEKFIQGFVAGFDFDFETSVSYLAASIDEDLCPEVCQIAGVLSLKLRKLDAACQFFEKGLKALERIKEERAVPKYPPEYFEISIHLARAYYLLEQSKQARALYREVALHPDLEDENVRSIAKKAAPFKWEDLDKNVMPFSSYVPFR